MCLIISNFVVFAIPPCVNFGEEWNKEAESLPAYVFPQQSFRELVDKNNLLLTALKYAIFCDSRTSLYTYSYCSMTALGFKPVSDVADSSLEVELLQLSVKGLRFYKDVAELTRSLVADRDIETSLRTYMPTLNLLSEAKVSYFKALEEDLTESDREIYRDFITMKNYNEAFRFVAINSARFNKTISVNIPTRIDSISHQLEIDLKGILVICSRISSMLESFLDDSILQLFTLPKLTIYYEHNVSKSIEAVHTAIEQLKQVQSGLYTHERSYLSSRIEKIQNIMRNYCFLEKVDQESPVDHAIIEVKAKLYDASNITVSSPNTDQSRKLPDCPLDKNRKTKRLVSNLINSFFFPTLLMNSHESVQLTDLIRDMEKYNGRFDNYTAEFNSYVSIREAIDRVGQPLYRFYVLVKVEFLKEKNYHPKPRRYVDLEGFKHQGLATTHRDLIQLLPKLEFLLTHILLHDPIALGKFAKALSFRVIRIWKKSFNLLVEGIYEIKSRLALSASEMGQLPSDSFDYSSEEFGLHTHDDDGESLIIPLAKFKTLTPKPKSVGFPHVIKSISKLCVVLLQSQHNSIAVYSNSTNSTGNIDSSICNPVSPFSHNGVPTGGSLSNDESAIIFLHMANREFVQSIDAIFEKLFHLYQEMHQLITTVSNMGRENLIAFQTWYTAWNRMKNQRFEF